jgi:beta-lactamase superfamily II metal-dependent hydrolase
MVEIDILPASTESQGADTILLRFGQFSYNNGENNQKIILIDGGFKQNAESIIKHVRDIYHSNTIDCVINTHPDADHINGLIELLTLDELKINYFLVHDPWKHAYSISRKIQDDRVSTKSVQNRLDYNLDALDNLLNLIDKKKICREIEPFAGVTCHNFLKVIGPTEDYYEALVKEFPGMHDERKLPNYGDPILEDYNQNGGHFLKNPVTSAKNDSSVILFFECDGFKVLFSGDAGVQALTNAINYANSEKIDISSPNYFQIPHHGSLKNLSYDIFDEIRPNACFVSAPSDSNKHPSRLLTNFVVSNLGINMYHVSTGYLLIPNNAPSRGLGIAKSMEVFPKVYIPTLKG